MRYLYFINIAFLILVTFTVNGFAIDISEDTSQDTSLKRDKSMSAKSSEDDKKSTRSSDSKSKQAQHSVDIIFDTLPIYLFMSDSCVRKNPTTADFGISAEMEDGRFDLVKQQLIEAASKSSSPIEAAGGDPVALKLYMKCAVSNYSKMAQANLYLAQKLGKRAFGARDILNLTIDTFKNIKQADRSIALIEKKAIKEIDSGRCRFYGTSTAIQCGSVVYDISQNIIKDSSIVISAGGDKFFGVATTFKVSLSDSISSASEIANEYTQSNGMEATSTKTKSISKSETSKQNLNIAPFIPK